MKYLLRDIPDALWVRVKRRADREGHTLKWVVLALLKYYADKGVPLAGEE